MLVVIYYNFTTMTYLYIYRLKGTTSHEYKTALAGLQIYVS